MEVKRILVRIRPVGMLKDIDLAIIMCRLRLVEGWAPGLDDARATDASYVNIILSMPATGEDEVKKLRSTFEEMPRMRAFLWKGHKSEVPLDKVDVSTLESAADAFGRVYRRDGGARL